MNNTEIPRRLLSGPTWEQRFDEDLIGNDPTEDYFFFDPEGESSFRNDKIIIVKVKSFISDLLEEAINELETNPHPGTEFKNLQYWIEAKQIQLKDKYGIK